MERQLVSRLEYWLVQGGLYALLAAILLRLAFGYLADKHIWLLESQLVWACLLIAAHYACTARVPGIAGQLASATVGLLCALLALSLIPRYGWAVAPLPKWVFSVALSLLVLSMLMRSLLAQRWYRLLRGHGFEWIEEWAQGKPFYARLLAQRVMQVLSRGMVA